MNVQAAQLVDKLADEYEEQLSQGTRLPVFDLLSRVDASFRAALLNELVYADLTHGERGIEHVKSLQNEFDTFITQIDRCLRKHFAEIESKSVPEFPDVDGSSEETYRSEMTENYHFIGESLNTFEDGINHFTVLKTLGEGGMGSVFKAQQTSPVQRNVALKLIKPGVWSEEVLKRFEAERQAMAVMDHPYIARIYSAGITPDKQPYFSMELIDGIPLNEYCNKYKLSIKERLKLFLKVCDAIEHAHQNAIIHRDLKPNNVPVVNKDGQHIPKIIDFGLAKAVEPTQRLSDKTLVTEIGQVLGTLKYMSPEQASIGKLSIDTRSDVFALGVMLYEILVGETPINDSELQGKDIIEAISYVSQFEPKPPSGTLAEMTVDQSELVIDSRGISLESLHRELKGELDWIVLKSIEKDIKQRYRSVGELSEDIKRYCANEPILAKPPSAQYVLKKFVRKHRKIVSFIATVAFLVVIGAVGTSWGMFRAMAAERKADLRANLAIKARKTADEKAKAERKARLAETREKKFAQAIVDFVRKDILALTSVHGQHAAGFEYYELGKNATLADLLDLAASKLLKAKNLEPRTEAEICDIIAFSYRGTGRFSSAIPLLERKFALQNLIYGDNSFEALYSEAILVDTKSRAGIKKDLTAKAKSIARKFKSLEASEKDVSSTPHQKITVLNTLAKCYFESGNDADAIETITQMVSFAENSIGPESRVTLLAKCSLGAALNNLGKHERAFEILSGLESLTKRTNVLSLQDKLTIQNNLGHVLLNMEQFADAEFYFKDAEHSARQNLEKHNTAWIKSIQNLGQLYKRKGEYQLAIEFIKQSLVVLEERLGRYHPVTCDTIADLAYCHWKLKQFDQSLPLYRQLIDRYRKVHTVPVAKTHHALANFGVNLKDSGSVQESVAVLKQVCQDTWTEPDFKWVKLQLLDAYVADDQVDLAVALVERMHKETGQHFPEPSVDFTNVLGKLVRKLLSDKKYHNAELVSGVQLSMLEKIAPNEWILPNTQHVLGCIFFKLEKYKESERMLLQSRTGWMTFEKKIGKRTFLQQLEDNTNALILLYETLDRPDDAKAVLDEFEAKQKKVPSKQ